MTAPPDPHYVLPASVPTPAVGLLAGAAVAAWVAVHLLWRRPRGAGGRALRFGVCVVVGFAAMEALWQVFQRGLVLATNWWLWPLSLLAAVAVEIVLALYARERRTVSRPVGLSLAALRVLLVVLVVVMLAQPVRPWNLDTTLQRWIAVLIDTSASMYVPDTQLSASERLRLAERLGVHGADRPVALDRVAEAVETLRGDLSAQAEWLAGLASAHDVPARTKQLAARRQAMYDAFTAARKAAVEHAQTLGTPGQSSLNLDEKVTKELDAVRRRLTGPIRDRLKEAADLTADSRAGDLEASRPRLLATLRAAADDLGEAAAAVESLSHAIDEAAYAALPDPVRRRVDQAAARKRVALARAILLGRPGTRDTAPDTEQDGNEAGQSLLARLQDRYSVQAYTFASEPVEADVPTLVEAYQAGREPDPDAADLPPDRQQTDLTAVFDKVMSEMSGRRLSGILLLSDGRHNAPGSVEPLVRRLGIRQVPVSSVVFGGDRPPTDAGIVSVSAPEAIAKGDRLLVTAHVKLDGLAGKEVRVTLTDGQTEVDSETLRVPTATYRAHVQLAHKPEEARLHRYAVAVEAFEEEVLATNNRYPLAVSVSDERTQLLLVDGRPRWEFRYIKNLFAGRDRTVHLQYVLTEPDVIAGVPAPPRVHASASRPVEEIEATALPKDETEWMKFDVIILGDVGPDVLAEPQQEILKKFVEQRGGTLVVVAGPTHMPHAYGDGPLARMLPVAYETAPGPVPGPPEERFHLALTAEGRESVVMRQKVNPQENLEVWHDLPPIYWRHAGVRAKQGATVLAYALPPAAPDYMPAVGSDDASARAPPDAETLAKRREFQRRRPLITHHTVAAGRVMFLGLDRTWRLRYRVGDTLHHRLWGQILRWATANKLPAGTETVKIGTDRIRYAPGETVRVKARIAREDFTPVLGRHDVAVTVYADDKRIMNQSLAYVENSPGLYEASLGSLPSGTYRVELDAPVADPILHRQNADAVWTEFSVDPTTPAEQTELAPDRGLLSRLAALTGGTVVGPARAERVLDCLGRPTETKVERHEYVIWDSLPLLLFLVAVATAEWLLRKKVGLA